MYVQTFKSKEYPNSVFFSGKLVSNAEDNDKMQEDYYALMNQTKPDDDSEIKLPFVYMEDTYNYQWGEISKRIISYNTTHTVYFGKDKQGLDEFTAYTRISLLKFKQENSEFSSLFHNSSFIIGFCVLSKLRCRGRIGFLESLLPCQKVTLKHPNLLLDQCNKPVFTWVTVLSTTWIQCFNYI
ncbi:MAG: hypothetical protein R2852_06480 [Bacteroidia bacterium]